MPLPKSLKEISRLLKKGGVAVMPTDTIYGICGSALIRGAAERIYRLRKRNRRKPMIVLIAGASDLRKFGIVPDRAASDVLRKRWPGKVSVLLPLPAAAMKKFAYLHRGTGRIAFRAPRPAWLRALLRESGPLVAPSANIEGRPPARTIHEAFGYFGNRADGYVDAGTIIGRPSALLAIEDGAVRVVRRG